MENFQTENEDLKKMNHNLVGRLVTEKEGMMDQFNKMNDMLETLQKEIDMLRLLQKQQEKQKSLFTSSTQRDSVSSQLSPGNNVASVRKFGGSITPPSEPKFLICAHSDEAVAVK